MALVEPIGKSSFLENSLFLGDLGPDRITGRLGWLEWVESKEIAAWDDWDQLPSNSRSSSTPAACHLADVGSTRRSEIDNSALVPVTYHASKQDSQ